MESWSRLTNELIKTIDAQATQPKENPVLKNTLKTLVEIPVSAELGGGSVYSRRSRFNLGRRFDGLAQLYIKCEMQTSATEDSFVCQPGLATRIFDEVSLRTLGSDTILAVIKPEYSFMRIDEYVGTPLESRYAAAISPPATFNESTSPTVTIRNATVFLPLSFWFSETPNTFLNTRNMEELCVFIRTNSSKELMGMPDMSFDNATFTLMCLYQDTNNSSLNSELKNSVKVGLPRTIKGSYDTFFEERVNISIGQTSQKLLCRCPYPAFALHAVLLNPLTQTRANIQRMTLTVNGVKFLDLDYRINFQNYALFNKGFVESEAFSYWLSIQKDRSVDSGLITCSIGDNMAPFIMEVFFDGPTAAHELVTFWEYRTNFSVGETGTIQQNQGASRLAFSNNTGFQN